MDQSSQFETVHTITARGNIGSTLIDAGGGGSFLNRILSPTIGRWDLRKLKTAEETDVGFPSVCHD